MTKWSIAISVLTIITPFASAEEKFQTGTVHFRHVGNQKNIPKRYQLAEHKFSYEMDRKLKASRSGMEIWRLRFPSPVKSACEQNNTVHAEYYRPKGKGPFPGVIVLDITGGDQTLSRIFATHFANNGVAGLFVQMAYYGPRRPPGSRLRLLSTDVPHTIAAVRQTVLDMRCASAWLESRPEIDGKNIGIVGTSLGSFIAALTAEMEPRLGKVAVLLGGGGFVDAYYDDPRGAQLVGLWEFLGGDKASLKKLIAPVDPITCAANLRNRKVLILAAKRDDIVPPRCAEMLWEATGKQKIVWFNCTHYGAALFIVPGLRHITDHFRVQ